MVVNDLMRENGHLTSETERLQREVTKLREALRNLYVSAVDQRRGYADKDLHEAPSETLQRAYNVLCEAEDDGDTVPEPPK